MYIHIFIFLKKAGHSRGSTDTPCLRPIGELYSILGRPFLLPGTE